MNRITRLNDDAVVTFAAEELKKYLRMMMPDCGEISLAYSDSADGCEGYVLGLMSDFWIPEPAVEDPRLDDVLYCKTGKDGGIIAGNNPRSVLLSVYRFLRENGCRFLFPGPDGEIIPLASPKPTFFCEKADLRFRGQCNEGSETQQIMFDAIDFTPKLGMNTFMIEFSSPRSYYEQYYSHKYEPGFPAEDLTDEQLRQWKIACECEIQKRGLLFHDMGHGWTSVPFGLPEGTWDRMSDDVIPPESRKYLAEVGGKRKLHDGLPINTNFCMSNPDARRIVVRYIADYAQRKTNVDFLHVWLSDGRNNHCECEACKTKAPSDWYMILMNEIDEDLTERGLDTHIVFISYHDTLWAPKTEKIANPRRFSLLFAPINRSYCETYAKDADHAAMTEYHRNRLEMPSGMAVTMAYLEDWKKVFSGDVFCYEYHYWINQFYDLGGTHIARIVSEDVKHQKKHGLCGLIEDGSQRSAFPNGLSFYTYGLTLFDNSLSFDRIEEDYFLHAYGDDWREVKEYLDALSDEGLIRLCYCEIAPGSPEGKATLASFPALREKIRTAKVLCDKPRKLRFHAQAVSWDLLRIHTEYAQYYLDIVEKIAENDMAGARAILHEMCIALGKWGMIYHSAYDHPLAARTFEFMIWRAESERSSQVND